MIEARSEVLGDIGYVRLRRRIVKGQGYQITEQEPTEEEDKEREEGQ